MKENEEGNLKGDRWRRERGWIYVKKVKERRMFEGGRRKNEKKEKIERNKDEWKEENSEV